MLSELNLLLRSAAFVVLATTLSACVATEEPPLDLESRTIAVEQNAIPAGADAVGSVSHLLPSTGPTYVTLTVSRFDKFDTSKDTQANKSAITSGSGFVVDPNGYVITAAHVAHKKDYLISARAANGRIYSGKVIDVFPENDMALIKLRGYTGKSVTPAESACVPKGSLVYSLGRPHAAGDTARVGTLEAMHFTRPVSYGKFGYPDALVLRMSTRKGESGGPLFNSNGQFIGMVVSTLSDQTGQSINLAHAVHGSAVAKFFCTHAQCSDRWVKLASSEPDACSDF
jgi:S1-C subfamily serine protease